MDRSVAVVGGLRLRQLLSKKIKWFCHAQVCLTISLPFGSSDRGAIS